MHPLIGTDGVIPYDRSARSFQMDHPSGTTTFDFHDEKSFSGMYAEWAQALRTGSSALLASAVDGMQVTDIARQATEAAIKARRTDHRKGRPDGSV